MSDAAANNAAAFPIFKQLNAGIELAQRSFPGAQLVTFSAGSTDGYVTNPAKLDSFSLIFSVFKGRVILRWKDGAWLDPIRILAPIYGRKELPLPPSMTIPEAYLLITRKSLVPRRFNWATLRYLVKSDFNEPFYTFNTSTGSIFVGTWTKTVRFSHKAVVEPSVEKIDFGFLGIANIGWIRVQEKYPGATLFLVKGENLLKEGESKKEPVNVDVVSLVFNTLQGNSVTAVLKGSGELERIEEHEGFFVGDVAIPWPTHILRLNQAFKLAQEEYPDFNWFESVALVQYLVPGVDELQYVFETANQAPIYVGAHSGHVHRG